MSTILIADDERSYRELLGHILRSNGFQVLGASNGKEALALMLRQPVDLVLLDLAMPEVSGTDALRAIRAQEKLRAIPVIVVTAVTNREVLRSCGQLGVRDLLLKAEFSLPALLERIRSRIDGAAKATTCTTAASVSLKAATAGTSGSTALCAVAASSSEKPASLARPPQKRVDSNAASPGKTTQEIPRLLTREQTLRRVEEYTQSKTLAGVVAQVIGLTSSPRASMTDLVALLKRDVVLASRVLQVANTAAFATNKPHVATVEEAVRNVGLSTVRNIASTVGIIEAFPSDGPDGFNMVRCWQHSFAVAAILQRLMPDGRAGSTGAGVAHLVGLCHELGEIVLRQCFAEQHAKAVEFAHVSGKELHEVEGIVFGVRHSELVSQVMDKLALPPEIVNPIREYLERGRGRTAGAISPLAQALRLADAYAHGLLLCSSPNSTVQPFGVAECRRITNTDEPPAIDGTCLRNEVLMQTSLLARLSRADEAKLAAPIFERGNVPVWYARYPSFSRFDPLAVALGSLAEVRIESRLPSPQEAGGALLVVAAPRDGLPGFTFAEVQRLSETAPGNAALYLSGTDIVPPSPVGAELEVTQYPISVARLATAVSRSRQRAAA